MEGIKYILRGVSIEQFATVYEPTSDDIQINLNIPIRTNYDERTIAVGANIQFLDQDKVFLIAEVLCHFIIEEDSWYRITDNKTKEAVLPKGMINDLARIAISTSRGVLCAKTENTPYYKFFLPLIDISDEQGEDLIVPKIS